MIKKGLNFHQTFKPEHNLLCGLLQSLTECSGKTAQEISKLTGIPTGESSGKVVPTIYYLEYMGLITEHIKNREFILDYTNLGKSVLSEDPGFMEELTLLLLHCMLVRKNNGAELWSYIVCKLMPKYHGRISKVNFDKELEINFGKSVNLAPFNGTYTGLFSNIRALDVTNDGYKLQTQTINLDYIYLYGFVLYAYWSDWLDGLTDEEKAMKKTSDNEITSVELEEIGFRYPFGWTEQEEYQVLELLQDKGIISLNRRMVRLTIRKIKIEDEILSMLYSELC